MSRPPPTPLVHYEPVTQLWVPGNTAIVEHPEHLVPTPNGMRDGSREGWASYFNGSPGSDNWFHFPFTNQTVIAGERLKATGIRLIYRNEGFATIDSVCLFLGSHRGHSPVVWEDPENLITGLTEDIHRTVEFEVPWPLSFGVSVSFHVNFAADSGAAERLIAFVSVGIDLARGPVPVLTPPVHS